MLRVTARATIYHDDEQDYAGPLGVAEADRELWAVGSQEELNEPSGGEQAEYEPRQVPGALEPVTQRPHDGKDRSC